MHIRGYFYSHTLDNILNNIKNLEEKNVENFVKSLDGSFAIAVERENFAFIAVDRIRSTPLFFSTIGDNFYVDCNPNKLVDRNKFKKDIDIDAILELHMSGYTIGNKTVFKDLKSLKAGELVVFSGNNAKYIQYYNYCGKIEHKGYNSYIEELSELTLGIFRKMLKQVMGRQIVVPLSAGNDSRLVASVLKHLGVTNVKCYSYGSTGNFESNIAKNIAKNLGYDFKFIPLSYKSEKKYYASDDYIEYLKFSETYSSVPYVQSLSTIKYLKDINWVDDNAVFINGNSGDFISGAHISPLMKNLKKNGGGHKERMAVILNSLLDKHFSLWGYLKTEENIEIVKKSLWNEIELVCGNKLKNKEEDHLFYEYSEFIDRQSKYVVTGQRVYEFYNYEWRLPLWDNEYLNFWQKVPAEFKENQKLYIEMLKKNNFGNVWTDNIPINNKKITPKWIIPVRLLAKICFGLFGYSGKRIWKQFDRVVFNYWMINTHTLKAFSYFTILKDFKKKPRGIYACWASDDYTKKIM